MSHQPLISVVVTCYNYAQYVSSAIQSVLSQAYESKELIVVNDGSTDGSLEIVRRFAASVKIVDQENQGSIAAYNSGFEASRGDLVLFLDADDLLEPDALSKIAAAWKPGSAKVQYDLKIIDAKGVDLQRRFCHFPSNYDARAVDESFQRSGTYRWPVTTGNAYSRSFIGPLFPLTIKYGPDGYLNTMAPVYGPVVTIAEALGCYRVHGENLWAVRANDVSRMPERINHRYLEVQQMRQYAAARGVSVAQGNVLDHELAFINYRLMAHKLGLSYQHSERDSTIALLKSAYRWLAKERLPTRMRLAHAAWVGALSASPKPIAERLIGLRFNRPVGVRDTLRRFNRALTS